MERLHIASDARQETGRIGMLERLSQRGHLGCLEVIVALLALVVAYVLWRSDHVVKDLQVVVLANTSVVDLTEPESNEVVCYYEDRVVDKSSLVQLKLENIGNEAIRVTDYSEGNPIRFVFPVESAIVKAHVVDSRPSNVGMTVQWNHNISTLSPTLLNPGDGVVVVFQVIDLESPEQIPFTVDARIAGIKEVGLVSAVEESTGRNAPALWRYVAAFGVGLLSSGLFGFALTWVSFRYARVHRVPPLAAVQEPDMQSRVQEGTHRDRPKVTTQPVV